MSSKGKKRPIIENPEVYKDLVEGFPDSVIALDLKGNIIYCNKATEVLTGCKKENLTGKPLNQVKWMERKDILHSLKFFKALRSGKRVPPFEIRIRHKNGKPYGIEVYLSKIKVNGRIAGFRINFRNVTEYEKIEKTLIRKRKIAVERAQLLNDLRDLNHIDEILKRVCEAVQASELFERAVMTLHEPDGTICHLGQIGLPPDVVKQARKAPPIDNRLRSRITSKEFRISDSFLVPVESGLKYSKSKRYVPEKKKKVDGGNWQPGDELFVPLRDFAGKIMGYLSVDTPFDGCRPDIHIIQALEMLVEAGAARIREVEAQAAIRRERDFSQSILKTANCLIVCLDADADIMAFNQECERVTGYRREEVLGKRWPELFLPPEERHAGLKSFAQWVRSHPRDQYEGSMVTKGGEIRTILWSNTAILGADKRDVIAIAIGQDITERKRAEEVLEKERRRLFSVLDTLPAYVYIQSPDHSIHFVNRRFRELFGDPGKRPCYEVFHGRKEPCEECLTLRVLDTKIPQVYEWTSKAGRDYMVYDNIFLTVDGKEMVMEVGIDITKSKQVEEALRESEEKWRSLVKNAPNIIIIADREGKIQFINRTVAGISVEETIGRKLYDYVRPEYHKTVRKTIEQVFQTGKPTSYQIKGTGLHRSDSWYETQIGPIKRDGQVIAVTLITTDITGRKNAEEKLERSREFLRGIIDNIPNPIFIKDRKHRWVVLNKALSDMLGHPVEKMLGKSDHDFFPKKEADFFWKKDREMFRRGKVVDIAEEPITDAKGKIHYLHTKKAPLRDSTGQITHLVGIIEDITERKRAEQALRESEETAQALLNAPSDVALLLEPDGTILALNEAAAKTLGKSPDELIGSCVFDLFPPDVAKYRKAQANKVIRTGKPIRFEDERDGRSFDQSAYPIFNAQGKVARLAIFAQDITERKQTEKALKRSEKKYRELADSLPQIVFETDKKGTLSFVNRNAFDQYGYTKEDFDKGLNILQTIIPKDRKRAKKNFQRRLRGEEPDTNEYKALRKDGSTFPIVVHSTPIVHENKAVGLRGIVMDMTEHKRAEQMLRASENKYRTLLENLPQKIFLKNRNSVYLSCNESYARDLKIKSDEIAGKTDYDFFPKKLAEKYRADDKRIMKLGKTENIEERYIQEGQEVFVHTVKTPVNDEQGNLIGLLGIFWDITERKRMDETLRIERERLETVTQNAGVGLAIISKDYRTLWANEVLKQTFGDVEGKICYSTYNQRSKVCPGCGVREVFEKGRDEAVHEQVGRGVDGKTIWSQIVATPIKDKEGNITAALEVVMNVTERKRAEETLLESEEKFRTLAEQSPNMIFINQKGRVVYANKKCEEIMGYKKEEFYSPDFNFFALHAPEYRETVKASFARHIKGKEIEPYECALITRKGKRIETILSTKVLHYRGERAILGIITDISRRKKMEEALRENEERYRTLFEDSPISLWEEDFSNVKTFVNRLRAKGVKDFRKYFENHPEVVTKCAAMAKVIDVNNASLKLFKAGSKKELQRGLRTTFTEESYDAFRKELMAIAEGKNVFETEAITQTLKGDKKYVVVRWSVAPGYEKTLSKVLVSIGDITELKRAKEQNLLLETSKALSRTLKSDQVLKIGSEKMAEALKADRCAVVLTDQNMHSLTVKHLYLRDGTPSTTLLHHKISTSNFTEAQESLRKKGYYQVFNTRTDPLPEDGRKYLLRAGVKSSLIVPMSIGKKFLGLFHIGSIKELRTFTKEEIGLAQTIANQVAVAIENAQLLELVMKSEKNLKMLSTQLINVQENERKKIAQELHDEIGQALFAMKMNLDVTKRNLPTDIEKSEDIQSRLSDTENLLSQTIESIRNLTTDLRPSMLDDFGLIPAIKWHIESFSRRTDIEVCLKTKDLKGRFPSEIETTFYRILQEALINVAKHAQATEVFVLLGEEDSLLSLSVRDNGKGFDTKKITLAKDRLGLFSIKEQVKLLNGEFEIHSKLNKGTKLSIKIPLTERRV